MNLICMPRDLQYNSHCYYHQPQIFYVYHLRSQKGAPPNSHCQFANGFQPRHFRSASPHCLVPVSQLEHSFVAGRCYHPQRGRKGFRPALPSFSYGLSVTKKVTIRRLNRGSPKQKKAYHSMSATCRKKRPKNVVTF